MVILEEVKHLYLSVYPCTPCLPTYQIFTKYLPNGASGLLTYRFIYAKLIATGLSSQDLGAICLASWVSEF
jgi:hypothetical protein